MATGRHPLLHSVCMLSALPFAGVAVIWLVGGRDSVPYWPRTGVAIVVAFGAAAAFYPCLRLGRGGRNAAWGVLFALVAVTPAMVPLAATGLRFCVALVAIATLLKMYDLRTAPALGGRLGFLPFVAYLPNWFWMVLRRPPPDRPVRDDLRRLAVSAPMTVAAVALFAVLYRVDWSRLPFALEHGAKVFAAYLAVVQIAHTSAAAIRLTGGPACAAMNNPLASRTPADFWRRWNLPVYQFLQVHAFRPAGGARRPVPATLFVFAVSGVVHEYVFGIAAGRVQRWQMLFFMLQGCASVATMRLRPRGRAVHLWVAGTLAFNLAASVIFFRSVAAVVPFYAPR